MAWVFDLDGTLTQAVHDFDGFRRRHGLPMGAPILECMATMDAAQAEYLNEAIVAWEWEMAKQATAAPGAHDLLERVTLAGFRCGVVTRNRSDIACRTLQVVGLAKYFDPKDVLGRDTALPKPSPEGILRLLKQWEVTPDEAVMVGDHRFDIAAGVAGGLATVLVGNDRDMNPRPTLVTPDLATLWGRVVARLE